MNMFYIGEYGHMMVASALMTTFYFGGYGFPHNPLIDITPNTVHEFLLGSGLAAKFCAGLTSLSLHSLNFPEGTMASILAALFFHIIFLD